MSSSSSFDVWLEQAKTDVHYNGASQCQWQVRFIELYNELERANKIITRLLD